MTNNNNKKLKVKATNLTKRFEMLETTSNKMKTLFGLNRQRTGILGTEKCKF